jgi:hypothetical protein
MLGDADAQAGAQLRKFTRIVDDSTQPQSGSNRTADRHDPQQFDEALTAVATTPEHAGSVLGTREQEELTEQRGPESYWALHCKTIQRNIHALQHVRITKCALWLPLRLGNDSSNVRS